jgi:hypothetical protein
MKLQRVQAVENNLTTGLKATKFLLFFFALEFWWLRESFFIAFAKPGT